jgi:hypothetical protein
LLYSKDHAEYTGYGNVAPAPLSVSAAKADVNESANASTINILKIVFIAPPTVFLFRIYLNCYRNVTAKLIICYILVSTSF